MYYLERAAQIQVLLMVQNFIVLDSIFLNKQGDF